MTENELSRVATVHADAILGALSQPDIGQLFPDSDPKWKGQTSDVFVKEAVCTYRLPCDAHRLCTPSLFVSM